MRFSSSAVAILLFCCACRPSPAGTGGSLPAKPDAGILQIRAAMDAAALPAEVSDAAIKRIEASRDRFISLLAAVIRQRDADSMLLALVDKKHSLPQTYEASDLVGLDNSGISVSRRGHRLRGSTLDALLLMDKAARSEGFSLVVSSTYRSFDYQTDVFARNVKEMGEFEASRVSARPGQSQHQLGTAIDFGSIDNSFATTAAGKWLTRNAGRFGFSQSYPKGLEPVTGYLWESWHYRYIGIEAAALQTEYFGGVQQYLMQFLAHYRG